MEWISAKPKTVVNIDAEAYFFLTSSLFERTWKTTIELAPLSESFRFSWNNFFEILHVGICSRCPANCSKQPFGAGLCPETRNVFPSEDFAFWRPKSTEVICNRFHAGEAAYKASYVETSEHPQSKCLRSGFPPFPAARFAGTGALVESAWGKNPLALEHSQNGIKGKDAAAIACYDSVFGTLFGWRWLCVPSGSSCLCIVLIMLYLINPKLKETSSAINSPNPPSQLETVYIVYMRLALKSLRPCLSENSPYLSMFWLLQQILAFPNENIQLSTPWLR